MDFKVRHVLFRIDGVDLTNDAEKDNRNVEKIDAVRCCFGVILSESRHGDGRWYRVVVLLQVYRRLGRRL